MQLTPLLHIIPLNTNDNQRKKMEITEATARFFFDQIFGTYSGHMAKVPNNPQLKSLLSSHGVDDEKSCAEFLRQVSLHLKEIDFKF